MGITNLSETGGENKRQGERYVDAIRNGEDVQVIESKHKESMEKSSGVAKEYEFKARYLLLAQSSLNSQQHKNEYLCK